MQRARKTKVIYPGTFDPLTNGHLDLIARASKIVDELVVAVHRNSEQGSSDKGKPLFTFLEREQMLREATTEMQNVSVTTFDGLLVRFAKAQKANAVLRGIRAVSDYEYELQMAMMNRRLNSAVETVFLMTEAEHSYLSSSIVKEIARLGGSVEGLVPNHVRQRLQQKNNET